MVIKDKGTKPKWRLWLSCLGRWLLRFIAALVVIYFWGMIWFDGPFVSGEFLNGFLGLAWVGLFIFFWWKYRSRRSRWITCGSACVLILLPRLFLQPSNDRDWSPEFARTGSSIQNDDVVVLKEVRNFDYTRDGEQTERWETRTVHLSNLRGMDLFHSTFGGGSIAHPLLSFDFGPDGRVCLTVETRRERTEEFSVFGGLYKMFELQYIFSTEEDCVRLRASVRDEPCYMYRVNMPVDNVREFFLSALAVQNDLAEKPRFYHILFSNCTTSLRDRLPANQRGRFDIRMFVNGMLDQYLYEKNHFVGEGLPFPELRKKAYINPAAKEAHDDLGFSEVIRQGRPGM